MQGLNLYYNNFPHWKKKLNKYFSVPFKILRSPLLLSFKYLRYLNFYRAITIYLLSFNVHYIFIITAYEFITLSHPTICLQDCENTPKYKVFGGNGRSTKIDSTLICYTVDHSSSYKTGLASNLTLTRMRKLDNFILLRAFTQQRTIKHIFHLN